MRIDSKRDRNKNAHSSFFYSYSFSHPFSFSLCFFFIVLCFIFLFLGAEQVTALGASPASVALETLPGGYAEASILLSNPKDEPVVVSATVEGVDWVETAFNVSLKARGSERLTLAVRPPADAEPRSYDAKLLLTSMPTGVPGAIGNRLALTLAVPLSITVASEARPSCILGGFVLGDAELGQPLRASFSVKNTGNVRLSPRGTLSLQKDGEKIYEATIVEDEVLPTRTRQYELVVTPPLAEAAYGAELRIDACGGSATTAFSVVAPGTFADKGMFTQLGVSENVTGIAPVAAGFKNTGSRTVSARFSGVVEKDGKVLRVLESEALLVGPGESVELESFFTPQEPGSYVVRGTVVYEGKRTAEKSIVVDVPESGFGDAGENLAADSSVVIATVLFFMVLLGIVLLVLVEEKKKRRR